MNKIVISLLACSSAFAVGCGGNDSVKSAEQALKSSDLTHRWEQQLCETNLVKKLLNQGSSKTSFEFSGNKVDKIERYFKAGDCTNPEVNVIYSGHYEKKKELPGDVHQIDLLYRKVKIVPLTQAVANDYNSNQKCGKTDWVVNQPNEVTASVRDHNCSVEQMPLDQFDIYKTINDQLYFGTNATKNSPNERPFELDQTNPYKKL
jgi:hypothetical protein